MLNVKLITGFIIAGLMTAVPLTALIISLIRNRRLEQASMVTPISCLLTLTATALLFIYLATFRVALTHGLCDTDITIQQMLTSTQLSPRETPLPEQPAGSLIVYYRYGCADCEAIYPQLHQQLRNIDHVYWVNTRSQQGMTLRENYPTGQTPSILYIPNNASVPYVIEILYEYDDDGNSVLRQASVDRMLDLLEKQS